MGKIKTIFIIVLVIAVAGAAGAFAAVEYHSLKAVVQDKQDQKDAAKQAENQEKEAKNAEKRAKANAKKEIEDAKKGGVEEKDEAIRGLISDMRLSKTGDGSTYYEYDDPQEEGIFIQPYILKNTDGEAVIHVILRHRGKRAVGFNGVDIQTGDDTIFHVRATANVATTPLEDGGVMEWCDEVADAETLRAMKAVAGKLSGKIILPVMKGSNDDRRLTSSEAQRFKNILELCDLLNSKKVAAPSTDS